MLRENKHFHAHKLVIRRDNGNGCGVVTEDSLSHLINYLHGD